MRNLLWIFVFNLILTKFSADSVVIGSVRGHECIFEFQKVEKKDDVKILINYSNNTNEIVTVVEFSDSKIYKVLPGLFELLDNLEELHMSNNDVEMIEANSFLEAINLRFLDLSYNQLQLIPEDAFLGSKLLTYLDLSYNQIHTIGEKAFQDNVKLKEIDLSHNKLTAVPSQVFQHLIKLKGLNLKGNICIDIFYSGKFNPGKLESDLQKCGLTYVSQEQSQFGSKLESLENRLESLEDQISRIFDKLKSIEKNLQNK